MLREAKLTLITLARMAGVLERMHQSEWRRDRLLILCYHGVSLDDEHHWRPSLYVSPSVFRSRMETLIRYRCNVLPLAEALNRLSRRDLPPRSVAITFDDGFYDFVQVVAPILREYQYPATVYLTTYYVINQRPVFPLVCSYVLWKRRSMVWNTKGAFGLATTVDLATNRQRSMATNAILEWSDRHDLSAMDKDCLARSLAQALGFDYDALLGRRLLHLMNPQEVADLSRSGSGVSFELHTHRHRTPSAPELFTAEIRQNRAIVLEITGVEPSHFCYPSGVHRPELGELLKQEKVLSATTCEMGLASRGGSPFLLPRLLDHMALTSSEFEAWISGFGSLLAQRATDARMSC